MATIDELDNRTHYLESEMEGEKAVTRHVLRQAGLNGDDLGALKTEVRHLTEYMVVANAALPAHGQRLDMLTRDVGLLRNDVTALRRGQEEIHARLDRQEARLDRHEERLDALRAGQEALREEMNSGFAEMNSRFAEMNSRFDARFSPPSRRPAARRLEAVCDRIVFLNLGGVPDDHRPVPCRRGREGVIARPFAPRPQQVGPMANASRYCCAGMNVGPTVRT
jgi:hypothetical protein